MSTENSVADEYFYALTLKADKSVEVWDPDNEAKDEIPCGHKLVVRQILLGDDAKEDEVHVIEAEAMMYKDSAKIPIAVLKKNGVNHISMDLSFPDPPVTFTLKQGTGPVHIIGHHLIGTMAEDYEDIEDFEEEEGEDEFDDISASDDVNDKQKKNGKSKRNDDEEDADDEAPKKRQKMAGQSMNNVKKAQAQKNKKK